MQIRAACESAKHEVALFSSYRKLWHFNSSNKKTVAEKSKASQLWIFPVSLIGRSNRLRWPLSLLAHALAEKFNEIDNLESTPIYHLDRKQGWWGNDKKEPDSTELDPHRIDVNKSNKPYLEFIYIVNNNLINLRWKKNLLQSDQTPVDVYLCWDWKRSRLDRVWKSPDDADCPNSKKSDTEHST